jgi:hypothetical protein
MTKCVYNTDEAWFQFLRSTGTAGPVNFWRFDRRILHLPEGSTFYFRIRGTYYIAGESQFRGQKRQTIREAWREFGFRNGVETYAAFLDAINRVLGVSSPNDDSEITSITLDHCIWYPDEKFCEIDAKTFPPTIMAAKFYADSELSFLPLHRLPSTSTDDDGEGFPENQRKLVSHQGRERSSKLIKKVKAERVWVREICGLDFDKKYKQSYIEGHHKVPLSWRGKTISKPEDIALLCPNCHVAIHKYMKQADRDTYNSLRSKIQKLIGVTIHPDIAEELQA